MKPIFALFLLISTFNLLSCKEDGYNTENYQGVWNYSTSQNCSNVMAAEAISDSQLKLTWTTCIQGSVIASVSGNQITIPFQENLGLSHQAVGTITENSMQFNSYRFGNQLGDWVMKVSASK